MPLVTSFGDVLRLNNQWVFTRIKGLDFREEG